jgi:hypothetical protein
MTSKNEFYLLSRAAVSPSTLILRSFLFQKLEIQMPTEARLVGMKQEATAVNWRAKSFLEEHPLLCSR